LPGSGLHRIERVAILWPWRRRRTLAPIPLHQPFEDGQEEEDRQKDQ
jgi:hypothetical protein